VSLAHWPWPDGQRLWPEKKEKGREEEEALTIAQVLIWMAGQGSACAAGQRLPKEDFTEHTGSTTPQRFHQRVLTHHKRQWSHRKH
jgi:hypothetical protein